MESASKRALSLFIPVFVLGMFSLLSLGIRHANETDTAAVSLSVKQASIQAPKNPLVSCYSFTRPLSIGSRGEDVLALKKLLAKDKYLSLKDKDINNDTYTKSLASAVEKFNRKNTSVIGKEVTAETISKLNAKYTCQTQSAEVFFKTVNTQLRNTFPVLKAPKVAIKPKKQRGGTKIGISVNSMSNPTTISTSPLAKSPAPATNPPVEATAEAALMLFDHKTKLISHCTESSDESPLCIVSSTDSDNKYRRRSYSDENDYTSKMDLNTSFFPKPGKAGYTCTEHREVVKNGSGATNNTDVATINCDDGEEHPKNLGYLHPDLLPLRKGNIGPFNISGQGFYSDQTITDNSSYQIRVTGDPATDYAITLQYNITESYLEASGLNYLVKQRPLKCPGLLGNVTGSVTVGGKNLDRKCMIKIITNGNSTILATPSAPVAYFTYEVAIAVSPQVVTKKTWFGGGQNNKTTTNGATMTLSGGGFSTLVDEDGVGDNEIQLFDGTTTYTITGVVSLDGTTVNFIIPENIPAGVYQMTASASDSSYSDPITVTITQPNPITIASMNQSTVLGTPNTYTFTVGSVQSGATYTVSWGDGQTQTGTLSPNGSGVATLSLGHTYNSEVEANRTITIVVTNPDGTMSLETYYVRIINPSPLTSISFVEVGTCSYNPTSIKIKLDAPTTTSGPRITKYNIYRDGSLYTTIDATGFWTDASVGYKSAHTYAIAEVYSDGTTSGISSPISLANSVDFCPIVGLTVTPGLSSCGTIDLSWPKPYYLGVTGYQIYRDGDMVANNISANSYPKYPYVDTVGDDSPHTYTITALYGKEGQSVPSDEVTGSALLCQ